MRYKWLDTIVYLWITAQLITIFDRLWDYFFLRDKHQWADVVQIVLNLYAIASIGALVLNILAFIWLVRRYRRYHRQIYHYASAFCVMVTAMEIILIGFTIKSGGVPL